MFEPILDSYRKATEMTMQFQQQMLRNMTQQWVPQWPQAFGFPAQAAAIPEHVRDAQKKWTETVTDLLNKHRESIDAQYRAGIRTIEDAFRVGEARDPEQLRKLTEELWKQSFESLKGLIEMQVRDVQAAMQKAFEVATKSAAAVKV